MRHKYVEYKSKNLRHILIFEFVHGFQPEEGFEAASEGFPSMF